MNDKQMIQHPFWSYGLVFSQFFWIAVLLWISPWHQPLWAYGVQAFAAMIGLWALKTMHFGHFNIIPDPMPHLNLVTTGPYRWIRHPMYLSILLFFTPVLFLSPSLSQIAAFAALSLTLLIKLSYEEYLILKTCPDYSQYRQETSRLIPKIF